MTVHFVAVFCLGLGTGGCLYLLFALLALKRFLRRQVLPPPAPVPVTLLKPLHGADAGLFERLATFLGQHYDAPVQMVCGVQDAADPAASVVKRLQCSFPDRDIALVIGERDLGPNRKVCNLARQMPHARHDVLVLSDADIAVDAGYLDAVVGELQRPGVEAVTCLYRGVADASLWARLCAAGIETHFIPDVLAGLALGRAKPCFGATIAMRRSTLETLGGIGAFADRLADDHALGAAVRARGGAVRLAPTVVAHTCGQNSFRAFWQQEIRWARTVRDLDRLGHVGQALVTHPLAFAAIGTLLGSRACLLAALAALALRVALARTVTGAFGGASRSIGLIVLRDLMALPIQLCSLFGHRVRWQGRTYRLAAQDRLQNR